MAAKEPREQEETLPKEKEIWIRRQMVLQRELNKKAAFQTKALEKPLKVQVKEEVHAEAEEKEKETETETEE